jgi:uncharacterized FlgJ-related protein
MRYEIDPITLEYRKLKKRFSVNVWLALGIILMSICFTSWVTNLNPVKIIMYKYITNKTNVKADVELTEESLTTALHKHGCVLPNVAVAQARLESQLGKSQVGKNAKNLFGITHHKCQYVSGKYGVYAKYNTYEDNIKCYVHIQDFYLNNIHGHYASDLTYTTKLKQLR